MNKETFLEELRGHLQILEDQEQEDILEEYIQHIDMKIQKGQSEEEAIRDFGPVKELAVEILEAYHVKPAYQSGRAPRRTPDLARKKEEGKKLLTQAGGALKGKTAACIQGIGRGFRWMEERLKAPARQIRGLFSRKEEQPEKKERGSGFWPSLGRGIAAAWRACADCCLWWLRLCWNLAWIVAALLFGGLAVIFLAGFGALFVLQFQGYPLLGIFLVVLGGMLIFASMSCGAFSLVVRKEKKEPADEKEKKEKAEKEKAEKEKEEKEEEDTGKEETEGTREEARHE